MGLRMEQPMPMIVPQGQKDSGEQDEDQDQDHNKQAHGEPVKDKSEAAWNAEIGVKK
jgi:hypothetical protein